MNYRLELEMDDWLKNAGIVGFCNILQAAGDELTMEDRQLSFDSNVLDGFADKYFSYMIEQYLPLLSLSKILSFEKIIRHYQQTDYESFTAESLKGFNNYLTETVKRYLKSNSYKRAYPFIPSSFDPMAFEKEVQAIKLKKEQKIKDVLPQVKQMVSKLEQLWAYLKRPEATRYIGAYNIIYTFINNAWSGVSFLNPQTKEKDVYVDYQNYFVEPLIEYVSSDKSKYRYQCFSCDQPIKDLNNDLAFLVKTGFDVARKSSNVWNFQNDVAVCPLCKLIYTCIPAGMTYVYQKGMFINNTSSLKTAIRVNQNFGAELYQNKGRAQGEEDKEVGFVKGSLYRALIQTMLAKETDLPRYELADVQVVRYQNGSYFFTLLNKRMLHVLYRAAEGKHLQAIMNRGYREVKTYFYLYDQVTERILNGQNQFTLIHKLLYYKLSIPTDCHFSMAAVKHILLINCYYLEEVETMNQKQLRFEVISGGKAGQQLRKKYDQKQALDKLNGIAYRLLNALKTGNAGSFMDSVLNTYLYVKEPIPMVLSNALQDEDDLRTIGYAFVTGLLNTMEADDKLKKETKEPLK